jgi:hypothetical protein
MNAWPLRRTDARRENRALVSIERKDAEVFGELCSEAGFDHGFIVAHVGPTTQPQPIVWPMKLNTEPEH